MHIAVIFVSNKLFLPDDDCTTLQLSHFHVALLLAQVLDFLVRVGITD